MKNPEKKFKSKKLAFVSILSKVKYFQGNFTPLLEETKFSRKFKLKIFKLPQLKLKEHFRSIPSSSIKGLI